MSEPTTDRSEEVTHTCPWGTTGLFPDCAGCRVKLEGRDAAAALRALDELESLVLESASVGEPLRDALQELRAKHQPKGTEPMPCVKDHQ